MYINIITQSSLSSITESEREAQKSTFKRMKNLMYCQQISIDTEKKPFNFSPYLTYTHTHTLNFFNRIEFMLQMIGIRVNVLHYHGANYIYGDRLL